MAVIMTSDVAGQTLQGYDGLFTAVSPALQSAPGFVLHASHPLEGGWRVIEIWDSREDAARFFAPNHRSKPSPRTCPRASTPS
jgi:hypothetical protein